MNVFPFFADFRRSPYARGAASSPLTLFTARAFAAALAFCVYVSSALFSQTSSASRANPLRNMALLDSVMRLSARAIHKQIRTPLFPQDTLQFRVASHEASWMLENAVVAEIRTLRRFRESPPRAAEDSLSAQSGKRAFPTLGLRVADAATRYFALQDFDSLQREISCVVVGEIETAEGSVQALEQTVISLRDTIARAQLANVESSQYSFARAVPPDPRENFWKQVIEPAVVILAGALTIALFFFVRTQ